MRTFKQWANYLPNKIRKAYLENLANSKRFPPDRNSETLERALYDGFKWVDTPQGYDFWYNVCKAARDRALGLRVKFPTLLLLMFLASILSAQDTLQLTIQEQGVTYTKFRLADQTLSVTFPGELHLVEVGQTTNRGTHEIGVIPGKQVWGFDSSFCYRIIALEYDIAIEIFLPKVGITLQYGNSALLYLMPEPLDITAFKQSWAIRRANQAREILLKEFSKRFNCSQGYRPSPMPVHDTACQRL